MIWNGRHNFFLGQPNNVSAAGIYNLAVVITNQAQAEPVVSYVPKPIQGRPTGGNIMGHASNTRVWLKRAKDSMRVARVFDSPCLPEGECIFRISNKGIEDVEEAEATKVKQKLEEEKQEEEEEP